ncbi:hypothetical protein ACFO9Q_06270 [Paenibacillus sp. GCM10023252]|uniref:hypothetical protein n=1 Tax=Paenibacillus sp. GCM10023252 TaxID=3252649 RepID=UPI0036072034
MRIPPFYRYVRMMQMVGVLLLGMIIGAIIYNTLFQAQFDALLNTNIGQEMQLIQNEEDIRYLTQFKNKHTVIKSILPRIESESGPKAERLELSQVRQAELMKRIKGDLNVFIGSSIYEIDSNAKFARILLDRKVYEDVLEKSYTVEVKTMLVVDNVLHVWVKVREYQRPPG